MSADDEVHALGDEPVGESALCGNGFQLVLDAPVQVHADGVGAAFTRQRDVVFNLLLVNEIDNHIALDGNAVGAVGVVQKSDFDALDVDNVGHAAVALLLVTVGADVRNGHRIQHLAGAHQSFVTAVQAVVVGGEEKVKAHILETLGVAVGGAEARVARVGLAAQWAFQVDNSQVCPLDVILDVLEARRVVVGAVGLLGCGDLRCMLHRVTHKHQVNRVVALQQRHDRQHQYGEQTHFLLKRLKAAVYGV